MGENGLFNGSHKSHPTWHRIFQGDLDPGWDILGLKIKSSIEKNIHAISLEYLGSSEVVQCKVYSKDISGKSRRKLEGNIICRFACLLFNIC